MDAAEARIELPQDLVFVDLETTGGNPAHHRITEVGIVRMQAGAVLEEWSSLVNPECPIPPYIESFTGITNQMVAGAPRFVDIARVVLQKLGTATSAAVPVFVAHNARFDYSFLRAEFRRIELEFCAPVLCTVKLSRRLNPEHPRHSLDAVMERHQLTCSARHRALGDARVLRDFWLKLRQELPEATLAAAAHGVLGAQKLPAYLPAGLADELPDGPGVYRFFDENEVLLYIGRSHSLRTRILSHFNVDHPHPDAREQKKAQRVRRIDWEETAGIFGAQLKELAWIKAQQPIFNKRPRPAGDLCTLLRSSDASGVDTLGMQAPAMRIVPFTDIAAADLAQCFGIFQSPKDARKALGDIARARGLCLKILGLEASSGSCFAHQMGQCKGACVGKEPLILHDMRTMVALSALKLKPWPFPGRIAIKEGRSEYHVLDKWVHFGTARSEDEFGAMARGEVAGRRTGAGFDADVYRILLRHLTKNPDLEWHDLRESSVSPAYSN